jgi:hypothetical protein
MKSFPAFATLAAALALAGPGPAAAAGADEPQLAAPGNCAEPRRFDGSGACTDCGDAARTAEDGFNVSGPARARFAPTDVAASAGGGEAVAAPERGNFEGRGPCDTPGSCMGSVAPAPPNQPTPGGNGGVTVVERPPKPSNPPGTNRGRR